MSLLTEKYFACAPPNELGRIWGRLEQLTSNPHPQAPKWAAADQHYYGDSGPGGVTWAVTRGGGPEGELAALRINRGRSMLKAKIALITAVQIAWDVKAKQDSAGSTFATTLSRSLLETFRNDVLATADVQWQEMTEVYSEAYSFVEWDRTRGDVSAVIGGDVHKRGDNRLNLLPPWLVVTDNNRDSAKDQDWWFLRLDRPKADLVKLYRSILGGNTTKRRAGPEAEEAIWAAKDERRLLSYLSTQTEQDLVGVVHFIHRPTLALPGGRHVVMLNGDTFLRDTPLIGPRGDYEEVPIIRRASDERVGTPFGYASYWDTLGPQEILDASATTMATTITTFGNPILCTPDGGNWSGQDAAVFGREYHVPPGGSAPSYVLPPELAESAMKFDEALIEAQQQMLSLNDSALGQNKSADKNAQADALAASMAVQAMGPATVARRQSLGQLGQVWLTTLRHNVSAERVSRMLGAGQANLLADTKKWTGKDLGPMDSVTVEETSPMESTQQGRWAIYTDMNTRGEIKSQEEGEQVRNTGRLDRVIDPKRDDGILIQIECEQLAKGEMPLVHPTQNALTHYPANAAVLLSITALSDPKVCKAVQDTLDKRYFFYFGVWPDGAPPPPGSHPGTPPLTPPDPLKLDRRRFLEGTGPLPQPMPPPGLPPLPGGGASPPGPGQPAPAPDAQSGPVNGPKNPMSGSPFSPVSPPIA